MLELDLQNLDGDLDFVDDAPKLLKQPKAKSRKPSRHEPVEIPADKLAMRERAKTDKFYLATQVLGYDFQPDVHIELFQQYIQFKPEVPYLLQDDTKQRLILWPRGHFKTTSITVEIIQTILNNPNVRILLMQGTIDNTKEWLGEIKAHFTGDAPNSRLSELFPEFCTVENNRRAGTSERWTTPARTRKELRQATLTVSSPKKVKAGQHFDVGFFDDLVNDQNYLSPQLMEKVAKQYRLMRPLIEPGGYHYVTGTRYTFGDLYEQLIKKNVNDAWKISIKNCYTDDGQGIRFPQRQLPDGRVIGFTKELLLEIQRDDPHMFACQYMNRPVHGSTQLFHEALVNSCLMSIKNPAKLGFAKALGKTENDKIAQEEILDLLGPAVLFIDLAASKKSRRDHTTILCGRPDGFGRVYVVDAIGNKWDPDELAMHVIAMAMKHNPVKIMIEGTASGTYAKPYITQLGLMRGVRLPIELIPVNNKADAKNFRIGAIAGVMRRGQLVFFNGLPRWPEIFEQFVNFDPRKDSHDDYPDTVGLMVEHFRGQQFSLPVTSRNHPLLAAILAPQASSVISSIFPKQPAYSDGGMGGDFAC